MRVVSAVAAVALGVAVALGAAVALGTGVTGSAVAGGAVASLGGSVSGTALGAGVSWRTGAAGAWVVSAAWDGPTGTGTQPMSHTRQRTKIVSFFISSLIPAQRPRDRTPL